MSLCGPPVARTLRRGADRISDSSIKLVAILPIYGGPPSMVGNDFAQLPSFVRSGSPVPAGVRLPVVVRLLASSLSVCPMTRVRSNTTAEFPCPRAPSSLPRDFLHILISVAALRHAVPDLEFALGRSYPNKKKEDKTALLAEEKADFWLFRIPFISLLLVFGGLVPAAPFAGSAPAEARLLPAIAPSSALIPLQIFFDF